MATEKALIAAASDDAFKSVIKDIYSKLDLSFVIANSEPERKAAVEQAKVGLKNAALVREEWKKL